MVEMRKQHIKVIGEWQKKCQQLTQHNQIFKEQTEMLQQKCAQQEVRPLRTFPGITFR
jgi:hypothetical protein